MEYVIGIDIGGTKCAIILGSIDNKEKLDSMNILDRIAFKTMDSPNKTINEIIKTIKFIAKNNEVELNSVIGIGISCGGPLDSKNGIILSPPNLLCWVNIHITEILEEELNIPTKIKNDVNAFFLAEWNFEAAKGYNNAIFLTFGTGMCAGLILNGALYSGTTDMAGEVGHIRLSSHGPVGYGKEGSFEGFCSGGGIAQLAKTKVLEKFQRGEKVDFCKSYEELETLNAKIVGDAAEAGDELAKSIYVLCGNYLGKGLSILIDILNPEIIVIGSIFSRSRGLLYDSAIEVIEKESLYLSNRVVKLTTAGLGEKIGDYAALSVAL